MIVVYVRMSMSLTSSLKRKVLDIYMYVNKYILFKLILTINNFTYTYCNVFT